MKKIRLNPSHTPELLLPVSFLFSSISVSGITIPAIVASLIALRNIKRVNHCSFLIILTSLFAMYGIYNNLFAGTINISLHLGVYRPIFTAIQLIVIVLAGDRIIKLVLTEHSIISFSCKLMSIVVIFMFCAYVLSATAYFSHENGRFMAFTNEPGIMSVTVGAFGCVLAKMRANNYALSLLVILIASGSTMGLFMALMIIFIIYTEISSKFFRLIAATVIITLLLAFISILFNNFIIMPNILDEHFSKFILLITEMDPIAGGRYATNLLNIQAIAKSPLLGFGLDSYIGKAYSITGHIVVSYDRGGSDILTLLSDFGFVGLALLFLCMLPLTRNRKISSTNKILILIPIFIKGIGIYSIIGALPYAYFVGALIISMPKRRLLHASPYRYYAHT